MTATNLTRATADGGTRVGNKFILGLFLLALASALERMVGLSSNYWATLDASQVVVFDIGDSVGVSSRNEKRTSTTPERGPILHNVTRIGKYVKTYNYSTPVTSIISPASECGNSPDFEDFFKLPGEQRSRLKEDKFVYETLFKNKMNDNDTGTYVELGAFEGREESNSAFFDLCLGWKGLLIEGNPMQYAKLLQNRPHAHKMSFAPSCDAHFEAINKTVEFYAKKWTNSGLRGQAKSYEGTPTVSVPCGPLAPVLQDVFEEERRIMFFSLDVEGAELMVLNTINFDEIIIEVMMIEVLNAFCKETCETRDRVRAKMAALGYQRYEGVVHASDIYVHPRSRFQMPASAKEATQ
jgi:hypothetical protein